MKGLSGLLMGTCMLLSSQPAYASITFRILFPVDYEDSGQGQTPEDFWTGPLSAALRGAYVQIWKGPWSWSGYLTDGVGEGSGYTPALSPTGGDAGYYAIAVWSDGIVQGNHLWVKNTSAAEAVIYTYPNYSSGGTKDVTVSTSSGEKIAMFHIYAAEAWAMHWHAGGLSSQTMNAVYDSGQNAENKNTGGTVYFNGFGAVRKFIIAHELGHQLGNRVTDHFANGYSVADRNDGCVAEPVEDVPNPPTGDYHSMRSGEWAGGALAEGFAHFYAADVWNDHADDDCHFEYYKKVVIDGQDDLDPAVDCESGDADFPVRAQESRCDNGAPPAWAQHGVELDWLRMFWDLHTNPANPPTFTFIVNDFLAQATGWTKQEAYMRLDDRSYAIGDPFDSNWLSVAPANGIDHP